MLQMFHTADANLSSADAHTSVSAASACLLELQASLDEGASLVGGSLAADLELQASLDEGASLVGGSLAADLELQASLDEGASLVRGSLAADLELQASLDEGASLVSGSLAADLELQASLDEGASSVSGSLAADLELQAPSSNMRHTLNTVSVGLVPITSQGQAAVRLFTDQAVASLSNLAAGKCHVDAFIADISSQLALLALASETLDPIELLASAYSQDGVTPTDITIASVCADAAVQISRTESGEVRLSVSGSTILNKTIKCVALVHVDKASATSPKIGKVQ